MQGIPGLPPGMMPGGIPLERAAQPVQFPDAPPALYSNSVASQASDHEVTWDFLFMHPQTGPTVGARIVMSWAMFDKWCEMAANIQEQREKMAAQAPGTPIAEGVQGNGSGSQPEVTPVDRAAEDAEQGRELVDLDRDPEREQYERERGQG